MESYTKLHTDCSRTIEQDAPIGISKQNTKSVWKIKKQQDNMEVMNNMESIINTKI